VPYFIVYLEFSMRKNSMALAIALAFPLSFSIHSFAQGVATDAQLKPVTVSETRSGLSADLPNSTASKTAQELETQNIFNAEDAFRYLPSTTIRKRYFGDRNANVGGRSFGVLEPGRGLVYLDGYLISQFLGRFDAPRWQMVNNESIERIDALYGPFSAIYPGNSIGTTLVVTERKPKGFEASASVKVSKQPFSEYGTDDSFSGTMTSARVANKTDSGVWFSVGVQHQEVTGHPMGYANTTRGTTGQFGAVSGTKVTGIVRDKDPSGVDRAIFGANSIDHVKQDTVNVKVGYEISPTQEIEGRVSYWRSNSNVRVDNYLFDAKTGSPVWSGTVNDGINSFNLNTLSASFAPSTREEANRQLGFTWKTKNATGWNASVVATQYSVLSDVARATALVQPTADNGGVGTVTRRDGTGWNTFELQSTYTPTKGDFGNGNHALTFGLHRNQYKLNNVVNDASDWRNNETTANQRYSGQTNVLAFYAQDTWKLSPDLLLTAGVRHERFNQTDGEQFDKSLTAGKQTKTYDDRNLSATSPKLSLAWSASDDLLLKASAGQGTRFPNVDEMFNGTKTSTNVLINNAYLKPEKSTAFELSGEKFWDAHSLRASLFRDDVKDTILRQSDTTVTPTTTLNTNVGRVLTNGLELAWQSRDVGIKGLDIGGSATWVNSKIKENTLVPASVGNNWLRIPKQRYSVQASYRPNAAWTFGTNYRYAGRNYNTVLATDINPETYGGISRVNQLDLKVDWKFAKNWNWAFGVDNVTNAQAWQAHSLPQRSYLMELRYSMK
jgi:iron complex outermembrane recepter protein